MINKLTKEQEALMSQVRDEWIKFTLNSGDELDEESAREGIEWLYKMSNLSKTVTVFVDSPLAVQYAVPLALDLLKGMATGNQVYSQVGSQIRNQVGSQIRNQVGSQVGRVYPVTYESLGWASGWVASYDFFERIGVVKHTEFKKYKKFLRSGVFYGVFVEGLAVMCRRPQACRRDEQNRLSYDHGPAIEWRDGYKLYFLDGVAFSEEEWSKIVNEEFTLETIGQANMGSDKSAVAQKYLRPDRLLESVGAKLVHTGQPRYANDTIARLWLRANNFSVPKSGKLSQEHHRQYADAHRTLLYEVKDFMGTGETQYCIRMNHPSIGREYIEWTEPEVGKQGNADLCQAAAWKDKDGNHIPLEDWMLAINA